ncbi:3-dehydroquinate synthase [Sporofaciens sp. SGI.106]|uniref:3-dehydroquinate synthase n=1 Tax=Sporofaciens sp. SGI.106 TaxID=3420568 RepID=UPI002A94CA8B|nr:3-dehydroquinate synthase [Lachnoclostridium sp.]
MLVQKIQTGKPYSVYIGNGLLPQVGSIFTEALPDLSGKSVVIISDSNVMPLYCETVKNSFQDTGCRVYTYEIPAGETSKNWTLLGEVLEYLAGLEITRSDYLIALGGGVVGDLTGFAASIYLRGISFLQIPTTLLAAVDSSVGGKTAVDLKAGKNLAGTFWQPRAVLCDTDVFGTLSEKIFLDGVAESIKYGILRDKKLYENILHGGLKNNCNNIVASCIAMKGEIVSEDEFDRGTRELLNLGHTFGHAIEACSSYEISHGHAVAIGMSIAGKVSCQLGLCSEACSEEITAALQTLGFDLTCPYPMDTLYQIMLRDKKRRGNTIDLILPFEIGDCRIYPVAIEKLEEITH